MSVPVYLHRRSVYLCRSEGPGSLGRSQWLQSRGGGNGVGVKFLGDITETPPLTYSWILAIPSLPCPASPSWGCAHGPLPYSILTLLRRETEAGQPGAPWLGPEPLLTQRWCHEAALFSSMPLGMGAQRESLYFLCKVAFE